MSLRLEGIEKRYGRVSVARALFLEVQRGELVWVSGVNGSGKSTMLRIAAGLCRPDGGRVFLGPVELYVHKKPRDRAVALRSLGAYLTSGFLYGELTGRQNLEFYAALLGIKRPQESIQDLCKELGIEEALDRKIRQCSIGMRNRIALARTFLGAPTVLLFDEPFAHLDETGAILIERAIRKRVDEGALAVVCGHETKIRDRISNRRFLLEGGTLYNEDDI